MSAFEIIGDGISLDVSPNSRLTAEFVATTFNEEAVFSGSFVYPVTFPLTPKNIAYFGHAHHLENRAARVRRNVTIVLHGMSWKGAQLEFDVSRSGYEGSLTVDNGTVAEKLRELTLPEVFLTRENGKIIFKTISLGSNSSEAVASMLAENLPADNLGFCWPTLKNTRILGQETEEKWQAVNDFSNMASVTDDLFYTPFFYHTWLIREVCSFLGYEAKGSYLEDEFIKSIVIYNTGIRTGSDFKADQKVSPSYHLPGDTIAQYLKGIRNDHRVMIYFDSLDKIAYFEFAPDVINKWDQIDVSDSLHDDSLQIKQQAETAFKLITKIDDSDELYKTVKYELSVIVGYDVSRSKDLTLTFGKPFTSGTQFKGMVDVVMPVAQQSGNIYSEFYKENDSVYNGANVYNKNGFSFRFLSYKGVQEIRVNPIYKMPFATGNNIGNGGISYTQSLDQGGVAGIINQITLPYYQFYCLSEKVTVNAEMNVFQFFGLSPLQKIVIADRNRAKVAALLDKVVFEPRENGSKKSIIGKITCYPNYAILGGAQNIQVVVGEAELSTPEGKIFAKLFTRKIRTETDDDGFMTGWTNDLTIRFYSDEGGAFAVSVVNLPYNIELQKYTEDMKEQIGTSTISGVANGTAHDAGEYLQWFAQGRYDRYKQYPYLSAPDKEFVVIGNYVWFKNKWTLRV